MHNNAPWIRFSSALCTMQKACQFLFFAIFSLLSPENSWALEVDLCSESVILINAETGACLFEKNSRKQQYPASITKIATAAYALNVRGNKLDKVIEAENEAIVAVSDKEMERSNYTLPSHWLVHGATHIGIKKGERLTLQDLLYGTMLASGGDSSNMIAHYIGGTIPTFMQLLNDYLKDLGCQDTTFKNPHGLHHPQHVTTAYDMAVLTRAAMQNPTFCEIVKSVKYTRPKTNLQSPTVLLQGNRLLRKGKFYYPKAIGVKTGYTSKAQHTLVAAATDQERTLIAVFMRCKEREDILRDAITLFEAAFKEKKATKKIVKAGIQPVSLKLPHASKPLKTMAKSSCVLQYYPSEVGKIRCHLHWQPLQLPVEQGQEVAYLLFQDQQGRVLAQEALYSVEKVDYHALYRIRQWVSTHLFLTSLLVLLLALLLAAVIQLGCSIRTR